MVEYEKLRFEDVDPQIHGATFENLKKRRRINENEHGSHGREEYSKSIETQNTFKIEAMLLRYQAHLGIRGINQLFFTDFTRNRKGGAVGVKNPRFYIRNKNGKTQEEGPRDRIDSDCIMTGTVTPLVFRKMLDSIAAKLGYNRVSINTASRNKAGKFVDIPENQEFDEICSADGTKYSEKLSFQQYVGRQVELDCSYNFQIMMSLTVRNIREYRGVIEMDVVDFKLIDESEVLRRYHGFREYNRLTDADGRISDQTSARESCSNGVISDGRNSATEKAKNGNRMEITNLNSYEQIEKSSGLDSGRDLAVDMNKRPYYTIKELKKLQRSGKVDSSKSYWVIAKMADFQPLENIAYKTGRFGPLKLKEVSVLLVDVSAKSTTRDIVASPAIDDWCVEAVVADSPESVLRFWVAEEIEEVYWQQEKMAPYVAREMNRINEWEVRLPDSCVSVNRWRLSTTLRQLLEKYS